MNNPILNKISAFLIVFAIILAFTNLSCSRCQGDIQKQSSNKKSTAGKTQIVTASDEKLLFLADESILKYLAPLLEGYKKHNPQCKMIFKAAQANQMLSMGQNADLLLVPGYNLLSKLERTLKLSGTRHKYVYQKLRLLVRPNLKLELTRPVHLLQPALKGIGLAAENTPLGILSRELLHRWGIYDRLSHKIQVMRNTKMMLKHLNNGTRGLAFVFEQKENHQPEYKSVLENMLTGKQYLYFYLAIRDQPNKRRYVNELIKSTIHCCMS